MNVQEASKLFASSTDNYYAESTIKTYLQCLKLFASYINEKNVNTIEKVDISLFKNHLQERGTSPNRIRGSIVSIKALFNFLVDMDHISSSSLTNLKLPKLKDTNKIFLEKSEIYALLSESRFDLKYNTMIHFFYDTGLRAAELIDLKLEDIQWDHRAAWVKKGKGLKERFVFFTTDCAVKLEEYLNTRNFENPYLFATRHGKKYTCTDFIRKTITKYGYKAINKHVTPHTLRRAFASHLLEDGADLTFVCSLLGHENLDYAKYYIRESKGNQRKSIDKHF